MPICRTNGFVALNDGDLVSPGFIHPVLTKERPAGSLTEDQLASPPLGARYELAEDGTVFEVRRQLPASSLSFEILFRKLNESPAVTLGTLVGGSGVQALGGILGAGAGSAIIDSILATTVAGGITSASTDFTIQVADAETKVNVPIKLTAKNIANGQVELTGYPLAVFSVSKEELAFRDEQLEIIGRPDPYAGIVPIVQGDGQFKHDRAEIKFEDISPGGVTTANRGEFSNRFKGIIQDSRRFAFRADNEDALSRPDTPFATKPDLYNDLTSRIIAIDTTGLKEGDTLYVTANLVTRRRFRHLINHTGFVAQTSSRSGVGGSTPFGFNFNINAFNFHIYKWRVPIGFGPKGKVKKEVFTFPGVVKDFDEIEGWRHTETISTRTRDVWAADQRGIVSVSFENGSSVVIFPRASIRDQEWFDVFLAENNLLNSNVRDRDIDRTGVLFDVSEETNSLLFDAQKIPYHRPFALALAKVSNFNSADANTGVGYPLIDLINNTAETRVTTGNELEFFDLSRAIFKEIPMSSIFPSAYGGFTCGGSDPLERVNNGAYFNPRDPDNRFFAFVSRPQPEIESDWIIDTPRFFGDFGTRTRIVAERMDAEFFDPFTFRNSIFYTRTETSGATLSSNVDLNRDYGVLVFNEGNIARSLAYHTFPEQGMAYLAKNVEVDADGTHELGDFSGDESHKFIGFNRLFGDMPSYSHGNLISNEIASICAGRTTAGEIFEEIDLATDISITSLPHSLDLDPSKAVQKFTVEYTYSPGSSFDNLSESDRLAAFLFSESGEVIDTVVFKFHKRIKGAEKITDVMEVDAKFYRGGPIQLFGDIWTKLPSVTITATVVNLSGLDQFLVDADQTAVAFDKYNRLIVFYADSESGNISVLLSADSSKSWLHFPDIIRLVQGEVATSPYVINNDSEANIRLFYVLNSSYLMFREVDTSALICEDMFIEYVPPSDFDENSDDDLGLENYTDGGKVLRKQPSYFVCGDKENEFLSVETEIAATRSGNNLSFRYITGIGSDLDEPFEDESFAIFFNRKGSLRLLYLSNGRVSVKASPNFKTWTNMVKNVSFHKNFVDDAELEISNLQLLYNLTNDLLYVTYMHNSMLFARRLSGNLIELKDAGGDDARAEQLLSDYLSNIQVDLDESRPIFLVGDLDPAIVDAVNGDDPDLLVKFNYPSATSTTTAKSSFLSRFTEGNLLIDEAVRPAGYFTKKGLGRLYYQSSLGFIHGLTIDDLSIKNELDDTPKGSKGKIGNATSPRLDVQMKTLISVT